MSYSYGRRRSDFRLRDRTFRIVLKEDVPKWNVRRLTLWRCLRRTVWGVDRLTRTTHGSRFIMPAISRSYRRLLTLMVIHRDDAVFGVPLPLTGFRPSLRSWVRFSRNRGLTHRTGAVPRGRPSAIIGGFTRYPESHDLIRVYADGLMSQESKP